MKNYKKSLGFTLIELLVVVAIIGVLSSVIIISLSSARNKATDAKIKGQLTSIKVLAEKYYDENGEYSNVCTAGRPGSPNPTGEGIYASRFWQTLPSWESCSSGICYCGDEAQGFAVAWKLQSKPNTYFCVDGYGAADEFGGSSPSSVVGTGKKCQSGTGTPGPGTPGGPTSCAGVTCIGTQVCNPTTGVCEDSSGPTM